MTVSREEAWKLLGEFVGNPQLVKHMLAVEAAMKYYAGMYGEDQEWWGIVGLLHDFDYEKFPSLDDHPFRGSEILRQRGYPDEIISTIRAHAPHTCEPRDTRAKKVIFAVDELCGFIIAIALIQPNKKLSEVDVRSVKKKLKSKSFARQINRSEIQQGAVELGLSIDEHVANVLQALQTISGQLEL